MLSSKTTAEWKKGHGIQKHYWGHYSEVYLLDVNPFKKKKFLFSSFLTQYHSTLPNMHFCPLGQWHDCMGEPASSVWGAQLCSHCSEYQRRKTWGKIPTLLRRLSAFPAGATHTTPVCSQWWCSNLTDWAQGSVCLKPLTYFYSLCRSQKLYWVIAELTLHVCSTLGGIFWEKYRREKVSFFRFFERL